MSNIGLPSNIYNLAIVSTSSSSVTISWTTPLNGGSAIISYDISYTVNTVRQTVRIQPSTMYTISGLSGSQTVSNIDVVANNALGSGQSSNPVTTTTDVGAPDAITNLTTGTVTSTTVDLLWSIPYNGGSAILSYDVNYTVDGTPQTVNIPPTTMYTVSGLWGGQSITNINVEAVNLIGTGTTSNIVTTNTTNSVPDDITDLATGTITQTTIELTWTVPLDGGSPITSYRINYIPDVGPISPLITTDISAPATSFVLGGGGGTPPSSALMVNQNVTNINIMAFNALGFATPSNTISATTLP